MDQVIKSYKGFNKDMTCKEFQYEEGKEYETDQAVACETGFHACEYPLDCLKYYEPNKSVYHEVEQNGEVSKDSDDTKIASTKIKIGAEISIAGLVKAAIEYTVKRVKSNIESDENYGASSNTGYRGMSEAGHPNSIAVAWGPESKAKGVKGSHLVFAEWTSNGGDHWKEETWSFAGAKMIQVDGEIIKEDTWYTLKEGKIEEVQED